MSCVDPYGPDCWLQYSICTCVMFSIHRKHSVWVLCEWPGGAVRWLDNVFKMCTNHTYIASGWRFLVMYGYISDTVNWTNLHTFTHHFFFTNRWYVCRCMICRIVVAFQAIGLPIWPACIHTYKIHRYMCSSSLNTCCIAWPDAAFGRRAIQMGRLHI